MLNKTRLNTIRKFISSPQRYPAAAIAMAAVAVGVAPVTATAAGHHDTKPTTVATATAKPATATTKATVAPATAKATVAPATAKAAASIVVQTDAAPKNAWAGVGMNQLLPNGTDGSQSSIPLNATQLANATTIVKTAQNMHLTPYAATIAVATSMQESKLQNLNVAVDHDSLGLFQQRPSTGWGSPNELTDPSYAANAFLKSLPSNYQHMQLDTAAQNVQRSFDGQLYAQWEDQASHIVSTIVNS